MGAGPVRRVLRVASTSRPRPGARGSFDHSIPPLEAQRYRYTFKVDFSKTMGPGIAPTNATGTGTVTIGPGDGLVEGTGTFFGTRVGRDRGQPVRPRHAAHTHLLSPVAFGGEIQGDQVTLGFTAIERPFEAAWIVTLPVTGGEEIYTSRQPFCGTRRACQRPRRRSP